MEELIVTTRAKDPPILDLLSGERHSLQPKIPTTVACSVGHRLSDISGRGEGLATSSNGP
jgi:hypothetical protein